MGDAVEVSVISAVIPKGEGRSADTESFVMINIDGRHQVAVLCVCARVGAAACRWYQWLLTR